MLRRALFGLLACAAAAAAAGVRDPEFNRIPFDQWRAAPDKTPLRCKLRTPPPQLHPNQRLLGRFEVELDGADVEPRRGKGELRVFVQIEDPSGAIYQDHGDVKLGEVQPGMRAYNITYTETFFVTPGQFRFSVVILHTATGDHWARRASLTVAPIKNDPLAGAWVGLPAIEFVAPVEPPETYYLPGLESRLARRPAPAQPLDIDILVNLSPSPRQSGRLAVERRNLEFLIPALRALSELLPESGRVEASLVDLLRHRVRLTQDARKPLDAEKLRAALVADAGKVDVSTLAHHNMQASYFQEQVEKRLTPGRTLIVLSALVELEPGDPTRPIDVPLPEGARVYYFCYAPLPDRQPRMFLGREGMRGEMMVPPPVDQLSPMLKPLRPTVFHIANPQQLRAALGEALRDVAPARR